MKFNVRVRIIDPFHRATHEDQVHEAESGLEAMQKAQADEKNTSRGLVQCNGCDPLPAEPVIETIGERFADKEIKHVALEDFVATEPMLPKKRGPKPRATN